MGPCAVMKAANKMRNLVRAREGSVSETSEVRCAVSAALEPTYRMTPGDDKEFKSCVVQRRAAQVLERVLAGVKYDQATAPALSTALSNTLRMELKTLDMPRYKVICHVVLGEKKGQALETASRCLWNDHTDSKASAVYQNNSLFAVATVYGIYQD